MTLGPINFIQNVRCFKRDVMIYYNRCNMKIQETDLHFHSLQDLKVSKEATQTVLLYLLKGFGIVIILFSCILFINPSQTAAARFICQICRKRQFNLVHISFSSSWLWNRALCQRPSEPQRPSWSCWEGIDLPQSLTVRRSAMKLALSELRVSSLNTQVVHDSPNGTENLGNPSTTSLPLPGTLRRVVILRAYREPLCLSDLL